jgi:hypothetical protein
MTVIDLMPVLKAKRALEAAARSDESYQRPRIVVTREIAYRVAMGEEVAGVPRSSAFCWV